MTANELLQTVVDRVWGVDGVVGMPGTPCPAQSQDTIVALRRLLKRYAGELGLVLPAPKPKEPGAPDAPEEPRHELVQETNALPLVGPPPYVAELVRVKDGTVEFTVSDACGTEQDALDGILAAAEKRGLYVDMHCIRHWITQKREHMVDFGTHGVYGRITSKGEP